MTPLQTPLILAVDTPSVTEARTLIEAVRGPVGFFKIGLQLFPVGGVELARDLKAEGARVFLDFKLHDIGATWKKPCAA